MELAQSGVLTRTDKPLLVIVFTLATNSAVCTETVYHVHCKVLYLQMLGIEPVANGAMVEIVRFLAVSSNFYIYFFQFLYN